MDYQFALPFVTTALAMVAVAIVYSEATEWWPKDLPFGAGVDKIPTDLRLQLEEVQSTVVAGGREAVRRETVEFVSPDGEEMLVVTFGRGRQLFVVLSKHHGSMELVQYWFDHGPEFRAWDKLDDLKAVFDERARQRAVGRSHEIHVAA